MTSRPLLDHFMPRWEIAFSHQTLVRADAPTTFAAVRRVDLGRSRTVRVLFGLRGLPTSGLTLDRLVRTGFIELGARPDRELVLGIVGRFWTPSGHLVRVTPESFVTQVDAGTAKAVWSFGVEPVGSGRVILHTATRVLTADPEARRRFRRYWLVVAPFSGWIRRIALALIRRDAEAAYASAVFPCASPPGAPP